ncbi:hypothetical protein V1520DRAFT_345050 [Lipomyces starkeyi]|uniref:Uncharacterized protein n=1 Tax=Lipomyces starkeyi NRRL Y-11557 TaxID=675824 RepID=A0A1E3QGI4_LIPST|nr:hypothetical protein LIPSTDRAFT_67697 [Lipomyces starkeyi NRRL Y-11557]
MAPPSGGVPVKNEIQPRKPTKSATDIPPSDDESEQQQKRPRVSVDPYASLRTQLSSLAKNPNKEIVIPRPKSPSDLIPPPPELVTNVQGSSAGAGSGEFHVYKQARRREMERTKIFEEQREKENMLKEFEERREQMRALDEERTNKKREKRRKRGKGGKGDDKSTAVNSYNAVKSGMEEAAEQDQIQLPQANLEATTQETAPAVDGEINLTIIDEFAM